MRRIRVGGALAALAIALVVVGCVTVEEDGEGDGDSSGQGGAGAGSGNGSGAGSGSTGGPDGSYVCCLNGTNYVCPDKAAFDKCVGFDMDACMSACAFDDFACQDACFEELENATHDPSSCTQDDSVDCGDPSSTSTSTSTSTGPGPSSSSGGPDCSGELSGCDYDSDCCSGNCADNTCWGTSFGNPCEYDSDCDSGNCYDGTCQ